MNVFNSTFFKRNPSFSWVWFGQILSQSAARMYQICIAWWILQNAEHSGRWIGIFMVAVALPSILLAKKIGLVIDRSSRQRILVNCDLLAAVGLGILSLLFREKGVSLALLPVVGFVIASLQAFIDPSLNKSLEEILMPGPDKEKDFSTGISLMTTTQSIANFSGAVLGALLIDAIGVPNVVLTASLCYFVSSRASKRAVFHPLEAVAVEADTQKSVLDHYPFLKKVLYGFGVVNFFGTPLLVVLPVYTVKVLSGSAGLLGALEACVWMGLILGAMLGTRIGKGDKISVSVRCLSVFAIALSIPFFVSQILLYGLALLISGIAIGLNNVKFLALFQEEVRPEEKGRFFAELQAVIGFTFPVAYFLFGWLLDFLSPGAVSLIQSLGIMLMAIYFAVGVREEKGVARVTEGAL